MFTQSFFAALGSFIPTFRKNQIVESAEKTHETLTQYTLGPIEQASTLFQGYKWKDKEVAEIMKQVDEAVKGKNSFDRIFRCLNNAVKIIEFCAQYSERIFSETETRVSLTYEKYTLMRTVQLAEFAAKYSRKLLNVTLALEVKANNSGVDVLPSKKEMDWVVKNTVAFCSALRVLDHSADDFEKHLKSVPDALINAETEKTFASTVGEHKYDPMNMRNFSVDYNPFYFIGMLKASYQAQYYESCQEDLQLLQFRLQQMQRQQAGQNDPKLEKQISYTQNRVTELQAEVDEMVKDWKLEG